MFTPKQIAALRYMIFRTKNISDLPKMVLAFLIKSSENLTKEVCLSLVADREGYNAKEISEAAQDVSIMKSCNGTTHIDVILSVMGSEFSFSVHYGAFDPNRPDDPFNIDGMFAGFNRSQVSRPGLIRENMPLRYTFWLSKESYSRQATLVVATRKKLEEINLKKPGLYPFLEPA